MINVRSIVTESDCHEFPSKCNQNVKILWAKLFCRVYLSPQTQEMNYDFISGVQ